VQRRPYSVILLDEMEKRIPARAGRLLPGIRQGNDEGRRGRDIDFKNSVIIMTSNAGF
jgi:ATP-dependent Clp protease ATP-binding subunit ClpA